VHGNLAVCPGCSYKVVAGAFQVPMSVLVPVFSSDDGHLLHKQLITHMSGAKLESLGTSASAALTSALERMHDRATPAGEGFKVDRMYSAVARALFDTTLETFYGRDFPSDDSWRDFAAFDSQFSFLAGGAPAVLFPSAIKALDGLCGIFPTSSSYNSAEGPASELMRDRRTTFNKLEGEGSITRQQHFRLQATIIWAQLANTLPAAFWTLFWILKDSSALEAVRAELESGDSAQVMAKLQRGDVSHLPVLHCCILEAMRLATGSMTVRQVVAPCSLPSGAGEVSLRVGDRVAIFPPLMHFDESLFPDASTFKWRRFLASNGTTNEVNRQVDRLGFSCV
jgi:cytochrome P450